MVLVFYLKFKKRETYDYPNRHPFIQILLKNEGNKYNLLPFSEKERVEKLKTSIEPGFKRFRLCLGASLNVNPNPRKKHDIIKHC